ncbi:MAG TPA: nucleotide-binding protein [Steroidobacteraceae bacterium]|nr:nucleotide-binding protein [Steroidobacteraceae bacterium]
MDEIAAALAKLAGIQRTVDSLIRENERRVRGNHTPSIRPDEAQHLFEGTVKCLDVLREALPLLYGDFHKIDPNPSEQMMPRTPDEPPPWHYSHRQALALARDITQILEIRANSELEVPKANASPRCVFITHGNTDDWRKVQPYIERDLNIRTIELAQEVNAGGTIIEKLFANATRCDSAVIVWTGDDKDDKGTPRARENVMHEIGFFQGSYGRGRVVLLHEEGVNVPTNLAGVVYSPFPKGSIESSFYLLARELKHLYAGN